MYKVKTKISRAFLAVAALLLIAFFYGLSVKPEGCLPWHQQIIFAVLTPLERSALFVKNSVKDVWNHYFSLVGASRENDELKRIIGRQSFELSRLDEVAAENGRLRQMLDFKDRHGLGELVGARVLANDPRGDCRVLVVDRGKEDGLRANMPVVSVGGLVGRVADVSSDVSRVLLLTDPNNAVDVMAQRSRARALLVGVRSSLRMSPVSYPAMLEYLDGGSDISEGDSIVTSGLDGVYPAGIPVGKVVKVEAGMGGVFKAASVLPFVDFSNLEEVLVVKR